MAVAVTPRYRIRARTSEVVDYHHDDSRPGKPLHLLVPGGLIALASLALILLIVYRVWGDGSLEAGTGWGLITLLSPFYVGGVFLFSYGYELYDVPKALKLTGIITFVTVAVVVIVAVLFVLLGGSKSGGGRSSGSSSPASSGPSISTGSGGGRFTILDLHSRPSGGSSAAAAAAMAPDPEPAPQPIQCSYCSRLYVPEETQYLCPGCGAATEGTSGQGG